MFGRRKQTPDPAASAPAPADQPQLSPRRNTTALAEAALADLELRRASGTTTSDPSAPAAPAGFHALSHWFAAGGRMDHAAAALWAHDLRAIRPQLGGGGRDLLEQVEGDAGDDPYGTVDRIRVRALDALFAAGVRTAQIPELVSATHVSNAASAGRITPTGLGSYDDLRATAEHLMRRAQIAPEGADIARRDARRSDLAAFDALLVSSALRAGDTSGITVDLRRALATQALATLDPQVRGLSIAEEVRQVRITLRGVVEPHEVPTLNQTFAPEPSA